MNVCACALAQYSTWNKVAQENNAAALRKASGAKELPIGDAAAKGPGATRGESVSEELIAGNARYLEAKRGMPPSTAMRAIGPLATPAATVVCLTPLPEPAHVLLGCAEEALFVVPCTPAGIGASPTLRARAPDARARRTPCPHMRRLARQR